MGTGAVVLECLLELLDLFDDLLLGDHQQSKVVGECLAHRGEGFSPKDIPGGTNDLLL